MLAREPEVAVASPVVEVDAKIAGRDERCGSSASTSSARGSIQPALVAARRRSARHTAIRHAVPETGRRARGSTCARATSFAFKSASSTCRCASPARSARRRAALGVMDIAGAQAAFGRLGRLSRIDLRLRPGVDVAAFARATARGAAAGRGRGAPETTLRASAGLSRSYRVNLQGAGAGRALHGRPARVLDAGARRRAAAHAVRAAARARA